VSEQRTHDLLASPAVDTRRVVLVATGIVLFLGLSMAVLAGIFFAVVPSQRAEAPQEFPQPRLRAHPSADLQQYLAKQREALNGYRWANSDHSLVAIPIERAMALIAERGAKGYEPIVAAKPEPSQLQPGGKP